MSNELKKIQLKAREYAAEKGEIVGIYKWFGEYRFSASPPPDVNIIEYIGAVL